ncbi:ABC transporter ATP-binding protein [Ruania alba]|uniref:Peptide/nickel transport system ATP-binding protein n=1 Tax=Ruania alba TaxID=648782 RepID=A0A1H5HQ58_9MICO|nr:ABC transporter ATP-binding protein [Ruania alba]SEE29398.1 peptide/nickel transport system ATP-binding protein [Ruania alba]
MTALLEIEDLTVAFNGARPVIDNLSLEVAPGEVVALVGESGSGKSMTAMSVTRLLPPAARMSASTLRFDGTDLLTAPDARLNKIRGDHIGMLFQQPKRMLDPTATVAQQVGEPLRRHLGMSRKAAHEHAVELLADVGIAEPERRAGSYAHQLSGGIAQRVMIAIALAGRPELLIADEPTTALDVTVEVQILQLLAAKRAQYGMAMVFISHDLRVVASIADRIAVMYAGRIVETGTADQILNAPQHPYTKALTTCSTLCCNDDGSLYVIPGDVRSAQEITAGCRFQPRCEVAREHGIQAKCRGEEPALEPCGDGSASRCWVTIDRKGPERSDDSGKGAAA